jgi:hypothetical protein
MGKSTTPTRLALAGISRAFASQARAGRFHAPRLRVGSAWCADQPAADTSRLTSAVSICSEVLKV